MIRPLRFSLRHLFLPAALLTGLIFSQSASAQLVPGTGTLVTNNFDDFEDENWNWVPNFPKASKEQDEMIREPLGASTNGKWYESPKRGQPDQVKRVATPEGGLPGSKGALLLRSKDTGIPGMISRKQQQDDFILAASPMSPAYQPNCVVRVYIPPFEEWEQRSGTSFGIRMGLQATKTEMEGIGKGWLRKVTRHNVTKTEPFYPGFFIQYNCAKDNPNLKESSAVLLIRADKMGQDITGPKITKTGWWTLGMSLTADGSVHYYAHPGVEKLTSKDHIMSTVPYGLRAEHFNTIFFNVCSADNGRSWSTPWIIDDPQIYYVSR